MKIAVVDDDIRLYQCLRSYLEKLLGDFAEITYFSSGEAFLEAWKDEAFDLIILDIFMDGITGMEVAVRVRDRPRCENCFQHHQQRVCQRELRGERLLLSAQAVWNRTGKGHDRPAQPYRA